MNDSHDEVVITAMGLVGCLALDGANACAAARAGLSRARELSFVVVDEETGEPAGVTGHPIAGLSDGFQGPGRVARVLQLALADIKRNLPTPDPSSDRSGWIMALPGWLAAGEEAAPPSSALRQQPPSLPAAVRGMLQVSLRSAGYELDAGRVDGRRGLAAAARK